MKTKEGGKTKRFILFFMLLIMSLAIPIQSFAALPTFYSNPKTHYDKYGTEIQYMSNHEIAFAGVILQGNVDIRTRVIGYTATVTANGQTAKVVYKRGNSNMSGWDEASPGFTVNKTTVGENTYLLYRVKYANFQDDVYEANKTLGGYLARGDYNVSVKFDAITEVYSSVSGKTLNGPNTTKKASQDALKDYNLEPSIWDSAYGMMMYMDKSDLPVVNFVSKSLTLPSTGSYTNGSTHYVQPGRQISVSTTYKSNIVNLTRQILKIGDPGGYSYVNDYIGAFEYGSQSFVEDDPGTIDFKGGTGSTASNADKNATVKFNFALKDSARNWTTFGEAYNQRELYAGGFKRSYETLYNFVSDGDGPRIYRIPSSDWTNQDVTFNIGVNDNMVGATSDSTSEVAPGSGLDNTVLYRGSTALESFNTTGSRTASYGYSDVTVSSTTSFKVTAKDNVGNTSTENFTVNIDKVMPSINLNYDSSWTNQNVPISWSASDSGGSGVKDVVLPNGAITTATSGTYTATSSGSQRFIVTDNAGNIKVQDIVVNIDKTNPTATKSQTPTSWTNGGVTLSLTGVSDDGSSGLLNIVRPNGSTTTGTSASETVYTNGTYSFDVNDKAGNTSTYTFSVTNIDTNAPTANNPTQTPTGYAPNGVTISLTGATDTGGSGVKGIRLPNGTFVSGTSASQLVTDNGTYTFQVEDNAGNTTNKSITVSNITAPDSEPPTGTLSQTPTAWTNGSVTLNLTGVKDTGGSGLKSSNTIKLPNGSYVSGTSASQTVSANGTYVFEMYDNEGNVGTESIKVTNIDKNSPTANISQTPTSWTDGDVTLTLSSIADSGGSGLASVTMPDGTVQTTFTTKTYTVSSNGTYTFKVEDRAGNEITRSITVTNIDKVAPTGTLSQTPTGWTDGNVTLNLTGASDTGGSGFKQITLPNGTTTSTTTASQVVTTNGTYSFTIEDNAGNITTKSIKVSNIDKTAPTANTPTQTPTTPTNGDVTISVTGAADSGGSGFKQITLPNGTVVTSTSASQTVSTNGTYIFLIEDNAGNLTSKTINVTNIDKIAPTANLSQTPTSWTNGNVTLNLTSVADSGGSGLNNIQLPDGTLVSGTSASYTVSGNGTYSFVISDKAGNETTKTITVSNIDKTAPTGTVSQTPTAWTDGDVTLNLTGVSDSGGSGFKNITLPNGTVVTTTTASQVVTANGTYSFKITDNAGNVTTRTITVSNIDKTAPTGTLTQTPTSWTNGNVTLNVTGVSDSGGSGFKNITLPNGTVVTTTTASQVVTANGNYTFLIEDNAGNVTTKTITVSNIDKTAPTGTLSQTPTAWTNDVVTLNLTGVSDGGGSGLDNIKLPNGTFVTGTTASYDVSANGTYSFVIYDNAGNATTRTITVSNIDKIAPTGTVSQTPTTPTNGNVTLSLTGVSDTGGSGFKQIKLPNGSTTSSTTASQVVSANGSYTFTIEDNAGNVTTKTITVSNIDKIAPTANLSQTPISWTNGNVTLNLTSVSDTGGSGLDSIELPDGTTTTGTSASYTVTTNGTYTFRVTDNAGNIATRTISVTNIDKSAPSATLSQTPTAWTNGTVTLDLSNVSDIGSGVKNITLPNGTVVTTATASYTVSMNGSYTFKIQDNAGNITNKTINVTNIDSEAPTGDLSQTPIDWTTGNVTLTLNNIADGGGSGFKNITLPNGTVVVTTIATVTATSNGTYTFKIEDNAGNVTTKSITVSNIDKVRPTASLSASTTAWTNQDVTLSLTNVADSGGSGLNTITLPDNTVVSPSDLDYTVTKNGTYKFLISDNAGNVTTLSIVVGNIDKTLPTASLTKSTTAWTNDTVTLNLTSITDTTSGVKKVTMPDGTVETTATDKAYDVSTNGTYTFKIEDNAGNIRTLSISVTNIDKIAPTGTLSQTPTSWTNGSVTLNVTGIADTGGSAFKQITFPNGTTTSSTTDSLVVTANGSYTFLIEDNAGNVTTKTINVTNIDKTAPTANLSQTPTSWTNGNVTLNLTSVADSGGSGLDTIKLPNGTLVTGTSASYAVSANGTYSFVVYDNAGNATTKSITVTNIDQVAPTGTLSQTPTSWTNGVVKVTLSGIADSVSGVKQIQKPDGSIVAATTSVSYDVTTNGNYTFKVTDNAGNISTFTHTVSNIDVVAPTATLTPNGVAWKNTSQSVTVSLSDTGGSTVNSWRYRISSDNGVTYEAWSSLMATTSGTVNLNGTGVYRIQVEVTDKAGNMQTVTTNPYQLDMVKPSITATPSTTAPTNANVTVSVSASDADSGISRIKLPDGTMVSADTASYVVSTNGTYSFETTDVAGNTETTVVTVSNIDKVKPTATLTQTPTSWTNGNVTLNLTNVADTGGSGLKTTGNIKLPNGTFVTGTSASQVVTGNGTYAFVVYDNAGNTETLSITVSNIDKVKPSGTTQLIPGTTALTIQFNGTDTGSGVESITLPNGVKVVGTTASYATTTSGTYTATVLDRAGNTGTISVTIQEPNATLQQEVTDWTNRKDYKLIVSGTPQYGSTLRIQAPFVSTTWTNTNRLETTITKNGSYSFVVSDGGILKTLNIDVTNFDRVRPMIDIQEKNRTTNDTTANIRVFERGDVK